MNLLDLINNKEDVGIFCIFYSGTNTFSVHYSKSLLNSIYSKAKELKENGIKVDKIKVIETYTDKHYAYLRWRVQELYHQYTLKGSKPVRPIRALKWKLYSHLEKCPNGEYKAVVKLRTSYNITYIVREFESMNECNEFITRNDIAHVVRCM